MDVLNARADGHCELCQSDSNLVGLPVDPESEGEVDRSVLVCDVCRAAIESKDAIEGGRWYCLQESIWSEVGAVQVLSYRLLHRMGNAPWATELLEQVYLEDGLLAWAQSGLVSDDEPETQVVDSNGTVLLNGDSVTLIKALDVKGANFTARRGTVVKNIRVGDDPTHIEGKVNNISIMLKTCFLKRVN